MILAVLREEIIELFAPTWITPNPGNWLTCYWRQDDNPILVVQVGIENVGIIDFMGMPVTKPAILILTVKFAPCGIDERLLRMGIVGLKDSSWQRNPDGTPSKTPDRGTPCIAYKAELSHPAALTGLLELLGNVLKGHKGQQSYIGSSIV